MNFILVWKVDAFTNTPLHGNPAGVVLDADQLSEEEMLKIANELNISETVFTLKPTNKNADFKTRFFTPTTEVDLCGHATIAVNHLLAEEKRIKLKEPVTIVRQETKVGILPIEIHVKNGKPEMIMMTQAKPRIKDTDVSLSEITEALKIEKQEIDASLPMQVASTGLPFLIIPLYKLKTLLYLKPDMPRISELSEKLGVAGFHVFTFETLEKSTVHTRCFAPRVGISEDPVTGTANGALAAYLVWNEAIEEREPYTQITSEQGYAIKRPGKVYVKIIVKNGKPAQVKVGGKAVTTLKGRLRIR